MTVFYDRESILVTDQMLMIEDVLYPTQAIADVRVGPRKVHSGVRALAMLIPVPLVAVGLSAAAGGALLVAGSVLLLVVCLCAMATIAAVQARPHAHELWITYNGRLRKVFETHEEWRVKQLARALCRAIESGEGHQPSRAR
jgi:hypothetical protein